MTSATVSRSGDTTASGLARAPRAGNGRSTQLIVGGLGIIAVVALSSWLTRAGDPADVSNTLELTGTVLGILAVFAGVGRVIAADAGTLAGQVRLREHPASQRQPADPATLRSAQVPRPRHARAQHTAVGVEAASGPS